MRMLTTNEAASLLGVTVQRIHQFINEGRLPAQKLGRDYIINEEDMKLVEDRKPGRPPKTKAETGSKTRKKGGQR
jgi:excisionase family DNA binding protein